MTGGGPQVDEEANVNQWETTYGLRVDVLAAVAYLLGPFSGAFNTIHFRESLTHGVSSTCHSHLRNPERLRPLPR